MSVAVLLSLCAGLGMAGGLAKAWSDKEPDGPLPTMFGKAFASALAAFCVCALGVYFFPALSIVLLAVAGITGWTGPVVLDFLGGVLGNVLKREVDRLPVGGQNDVPAPSERKP